MTVRQVFQICVEADVPGIPFQSSDGLIVGKVSIRHILKESCIPDFMVRNAHLLGDHISHLVLSEAQVARVLVLSADDYVLSKIAVATSSTPLSKALAIMEEMDTTYLFVIDAGVYKGIVSVMGIAQAMMSHA